MGFKSSQLLCPGKVHLFKILQTISIHSPQFTAAANAGLDMNFELQKPSPERHQTL